MKNAFYLAILFLLFQSTQLFAQENYCEQWPQFRGPFASGIMDGANLPLNWDVHSGENIRWVADIPGLAHSCPVVWGDRLYLTTAISGSGKDSLKIGLYGDIDEVGDRSVHEFRVYCFNRHSGELLWEDVALKAVPRTERHTKSSHANPTPATDGKHMLAFFGSEGLYCYNMEGELLWKKDFGKMNAGPYTSPEYEWGFASSPILHEDRVIVQCDFLGDAFLAALDVETGKELWRTARVDAATWSTPNFYNQDGHHQVVVNGFKQMGGYDFQTGEQLWSLGKGGDAPVPTPVFAHGLIYLHGSHGRYSPIFAVRPDARGDITLKKKENSNRKVFTGIIVTLISLTILAGAAYFVYNRYFRAKDIAKMLPPNDVVAVFEMNIYEKDQQLVKFFDIFKDNELLSRDSMILRLNEMFNIDFEKDVAPWLYRKAGLAIIESQTIEGGFDTLVFIETQDKEATIAFMEKRGVQSGTEGRGTQEHVISEDYKGKKIYRYPISFEFQFTFIGKYLVVGNNREILEYVIDADSIFKTKLNRDPKYTNTMHNVSYNNLISGYLDLDRVVNILQNNDQFMLEKGKEMIEFMPFLKIFEGVAFAGGLKGEELYFQTYVNLNNEYLGKDGLMMFDEKYTGELLGILPNDTLFLTGGRELESQINRFGEIFGSTGKVQELIFDGMLNGFVKTYFNDDVDLKADIYPLLQKEYLIALLDNNGVLVMLEMKELDNDKERVELLINSFIQKSAILAPKVVETELEDGTIAEEIQVIPDEMKKTNEEYHGYDITVINIGSKPWGIYYVYVLDKLVIASQKDIVTQVIDNAIGDSEGFAKSSKYKSNVSILKGPSDEISYLDLEVALNIKEMIAPVSKISWGKNYFNDGIQATYYFFTH